MSAQPSAQDRRILALLLHLQRWPFDAITGDDLRLDHRTLESQARQVFPELPQDAWPSDWQGALLTLCEQNWLHGLPGDPAATFGLTPAGRELARGFHRELMAKGFDELLVDALDSPAYASFCRRSMGLDIGHFSPVDAIQVSLLASMLKGLDRSKPPGRPFRWLDLGCGAGNMTAWLARQLGTAVAYGVDLASEAIAVGRRRHADLGQRLHLHVADVHDLRVLPAASFDALVAVDVLAFVDEPEIALRRWLRLLAPGGRALVLGSSRGGTQKARFEVGLLGRYTPPPLVVDLTSLDRHLWRSQRRILAVMGKDFEGEGRLPLYRLLCQEARRCGRWAEAGSTRRTLTVLRTV